MEGEIQRPYIIKGYNTHTPDNREKCHAIAFYDNFIHQRSQTLKIQLSSVE